MISHSKIPAFIFSISRSLVFPNRSMCMLEGNTILQHIKNRLIHSKHVGEIILCTSEDKDDDALVDHAKSIGIFAIRGKRNDIISRLHDAFAKTNEERAFIVRGDVPFVDYSQCDKLFRFHLEGGYDYSYNEHIFGLPYGLGVELIEKKTVIRLRKSKIPHAYQQELGFYIRLNESRYNIGRMDYQNPEPDFRFAVETYADYDFAKELSTLVPRNALTEVLISCLSEHNYLKLINRPVSNAKEIGLEKLMLFPRKIESICSQETDTSYPISVEMSLTNECNQKCVWCSDRRLRGKRPGSIPASKLKALIRDLAGHGTRGLVIEGGGEPTLYPQFSDIVRFALKKSLSVGLISNGILFNYRDLVPSMEWIRISLDADSRENYRRWKGRDSFYQVLKNIKDISSCKGNCVLGVGYVVTKHNIRHLEEITMLLSDYGVNYLYLRPVIDNPDMAIKENLSYLKKYESTHFSVMIHAMEENMIIGNSGLPCRAHSLSSVITADGSVFICGRLNIHDWVKPMGNINKDSFNKIWTGKSRHEQSAELRESSFCKKWCPECRLTKYNILFDSAGKIKTRNFI